MGTHAKFGQLTYQSIEIFLMQFHSILLVLATMSFVLVRESGATEDLGALVNSLKELDASWTDHVGQGKAIHMICKSSEGRLTQEVVYRFSEQGKICQRVKSAKGLQAAETIVFRKGVESHSVVRRPEEGLENQSWAYSQNGEACKDAIFTDEQILLSVSRIAGVPLYEILELTQPDRVIVTNQGALLVVQLAAEKPINQLDGHRLPFLTYPCAVSLKLSPSAGMRILECHVSYSEPDGEKTAYGFENKFTEHNEFMHIQYQGVGKERKVRHEAVVKRVDAAPLKPEELSLKYYGIELSEQVANRSFPWLLVVGGLAVVGALVFKFWKRSRE